MDNDFPEELFCDECGIEVDTHGGLETHQGERLCSLCHREKHKQKVWIACYDSGSNYLEHAEDAYVTISVHKSKNGAMKAIEEHKKEIMNGNFFALSIGDWKVQPFILHE